MIVQSELKVMYDYYHQNRICEHEISLILILQSELKVLYDYYHQNRICEHEISLILINIDKGNYFICLIIVGII